MFLSLLGLHDCAGFPLGAAIGGFPVVAPLVAECPLQGAGASALHVGSVAAVHRLSCSTACGIFPDQGWDPCLPYWQVDSSPSHQGSLIFKNFIYTVKYVES